MSCMHKSSIEKLYSFNDARCKMTPNTYDSQAMLNPEHSARNPGPSGAQLHDDIAHGRASMSLLTQPLLTLSNPPDDMSYGDAFLGVQASCELASNAIPTYLYGCLLQKSCVSDWCAETYYTEALEMQRALQRHLTYQTCKSSYAYHPSAHITFWDSPSSGDFTVAVDLLERG